MNTIATKQIVGILVAVIIIGGVVYMGRSGGSDTGAPNVPALTTEEGGMIKGSMRDLVALGVSMRCTFTHQTDISNSSGEVFVANGKVRGNFNVTSSAMGNQAFDAYMISDGEDSYVWSSLMPQGYKMPIVESTESTPTQEGIDYNQNLDYSCAPWPTDASVFVPPANITFSALPTGMPTQ